MKKITMKNTKAEIYSALQSVKDVKEERNTLATVSYTHLTLPTIE